MLNDKQIKSCLSRFNSGAYSRLQFLRTVSHSVGAHMESLQPQDDNSSSSEDENKDRQAHVPAATTSGHRNRQWQLWQQPQTTVAKCASWSHMLASHWYHVNLHSSVKHVLCMCQLESWPT